MSAAWERYLPSLNALMPGLNDMEQRCRAGIMLMRDQAGQKRRACSWAAYEPLCAIQSIADITALSALSLSELARVRKALIRMTMAARDLDGVFDGYE